MQLFCCCTAGSVTVFLLGSILTAFLGVLQFICVGNSLYEPPTQQQQASSSADGQVQTLPYCEGLEVRAVLWFPLAVISAGRRMLHAASS